MGDDVAGPTAEDHLDLLVTLDSHLEKAQAPYEKLVLDRGTYYLGPGGFLYRKDPGCEGGGCFCGYLDD